MITKLTKALNSEADSSVAPASSSNGIPSGTSDRIMNNLADNSETTDSFRNNLSLSGLRTAGSQSKIKTLPPSVVKDIEQKNIARKLVGLSPIIIKVRRCIACGSAFESAGNRTCGCSNRSAGTIAGREII